MLALSEVEVILDLVAATLTFLRALDMSECDLTRPQQNISLKILVVVDDAMRRTYRIHKIEHAFYMHIIIIGLELVNRESGQVMANSAFCSVYVIHELSASSSIGASSSSVMGLSIEAPKKNSSKVGIADG